MKKIKFPLEMNNGVMVRNLEELRENFDLMRIVNYYAEGKLQIWLANRYYEEEFDKINDLDSNEEDFGQRICEILGGENSSGGFKIDVQKIIKKQKKIEKIKKYTDDEFIIRSVNNVACDQEELADLLDQDVNMIYLCGIRFAIPLSKGNIHYVGVNIPVVSVNCGDEAKAISRGITFDNVIFDESFNLGFVSEPADIQYIRSLKKDSFEYVDEYENRINCMPAIACGNLFLKKDEYNIDKGIFVAKINWHNSLKIIMSEQLPEDGFYLDVSRDDAKSIFFAGILQPVYMKLVASGKRLFIEKIFVVLSNREFEIHYSGKSSFSAKQEMGSGYSAYGLNLI